MNDKIRNILNTFDENQLSEINQFLNSIDGKRLKQHISKTDKEKLAKEFENLDAKKVRQAFSGLTKEDLARILKKL